MKFTDVLARYLKKNNVKSVFGLQGGAVVHIFDSIEKAGLNVTYTHHEQTASLAATANAKASEGIGCVVVTTGPGCTNALTGLLAAWQDSIPVIFISGQVRTDHLSYGKKVRQVGTQEVNILDLVKPITKYCTLIKTKEELLGEIEKSLKFAISGRPGPVWIDIPLNIQWEEINISQKQIKKISKTIESKRNVRQLNIFKNLLNNSNKPLFVLGYGLRLSGSHKKFINFLKKNEFKCVTTWTAADLIPTDDILNLGIIGMRGQAGANKAVFSCDLLVCVGTHLTLSQTTPLTSSYAAQAKKIIVNIDRDQLDNLNLDFDLKINQDLSEFTKFVLNEKFVKKDKNYLSDLKNENWYIPVQNEKPNANIFYRELSKQANENTCFVIDGGGTALYLGFQSSFLKRNQRVICSSAISAMGTGLAEVIGAHSSSLFEKIYCVIGDGSFLMNVQDLQNIRSLDIPAIIIVVNNNGYLAIRHTQSQFLKGKLYGTHPEWGLEMPSIERISKAFGLEYLKVDNSKNIRKAVTKLIKKKGPLVCELVVSEESKELFRQGYQSNKDGTFRPLPLSEMEKDELL